MRTEYVEKGGCFGFETLVTTSSGKLKLMRDLKIGDEVLSDSGITKFLGSFMNERLLLLKFTGWMEYSSQAEIEFLEILTETGEELTMTRSHNVFYYKNGKATPTYAENLVPGNVLVAGQEEVNFATIHICEKCNFVI